MILLFKSFCKIRKLRIREIENLSDLPKVIHLDCSKTWIWSWQSVFKSKNLNPPINVSGSQVTWVPVLASHGSGSLWQVSYALNLSVLICKMWVLISLHSSQDSCVTYVGSIYPTVFFSFNELCNLLIKPVSKGWRFSPCVLKGHYTVSLCWHYFKPQVGFTHGE